MQDDLFPLFRTHNRAREAWERRLLADMERAPLVQVRDGLFGTFCEHLVARGEASIEILGQMAMPPFWPDTPAGRREWRAQVKAQPAIEARYTITDAGRARLTRWRDAHG